MNNKGRKILNTRFRASSSVSALEFKTLTSVARANCIPPLPLPLPLPGGIIRFENVKFSTLHVEYQEDCVIK